MQNLKVMQGFENITAPFDGVVTRRNTDVGALISASNGGQELFRVARTDILRVYVYVPQAYAAFVREGSTAYLDLAEFPGEKIQGKVAHIAGASTRRPAPCRRRSTWTTRTAGCSRGRSPTCICFCR